MPNQQLSGKGLLKKPENTKFFEVATATIWMDEDGIVNVAIKPVRRTIENQTEMIGVFTKLIKGTHKVCLLVDMTHSMPVRNEIREYLATELPKYVKAHAVVSELPLEKTMATVFQRISENGYPMNQFTNELEAKEWLRSFLQAKIKVPNNTQLYETPIATLWLNEDGILYGVSKNVERTVEHYKKNMEVFAKLMKNGNKLCFLADGTNTLPVSLEVREYMATEMPKYIKAHAVISEQPLPGTLTTAFIKLSFAGFPINQFSTEEEAKEWLKTFL